MIRRLSRDGLSLLLPSRPSIEAFRARLLGFAAPISTFALTGGPSWALQNAPSAVVRDKRPRNTPHELHVILDARQSAPRTELSSHASLAGSGSMNAVWYTSHEDSLSKYTLLPCSRTGTSRAEQLTSLAPRRCRLQSLQRDCRPRGFSPPRRVGFQAPFGECCTPTGQDSHRFRLEDEGLAPPPRHLPRSTLVAESRWPTRPKPNIAARTHLAAVQYRPKCPKTLRPPWSSWTPHRAA